MEPNASNAVCKFLDELIGAATGENPLTGAVLHDTLQEKIASEKVVRVGDVQDGKPIAKGIGGIVSENVYITLQFFVRAQPDVKEKRIEARDSADRMAKEFAKAIDENEKLSNANGHARVCDISIEKERAGWAKPQDRYAVHYYLLKINSRS